MFFITRQNVSKLLSKKKKEESEWHLTFRNDDQKSQNDHPFGRSHHFETNYTNLFLLISQIKPREVESLSRKKTCNALMFWTRQKHDWSLLRRRAQQNVACWALCGRRRAFFSQSAFSADLLRRYTTDTTETDAFRLKKISLVNAWRPWVIGLERRPITFRSATTKKAQKHAKWLAAQMGKTCDSLVVFIY